MLVGFARSPIDSHKLRSARKNWIIDRRRSSRRTHSHSMENEQSVGANRRSADPYVQMG